MIIYKITNKITGDCYIGQTIGTAKARWHRHIKDAYSRLNTHFARAIRKYGEENFILEIIDSASSAEELTKKEHDWIIFYDSIKNGYNETAAIVRSGGNTYLNKTTEELSLIGEKISKTKIGGKNPHSTKVKCRNEETGEEFHFNSQAEMQKFFNQNNHQFISKRCLGRIKSLYQGKWAIAYEENDYNAEYTPEKHSRKAKRIKVKNLETGETKEFPSYAAGERYFNQKPRAFSSKAYTRGNSFIYNHKYEITKIFK